jgi:RNA polymerase sigma factor (sigma-70 family)
VWRNRVRLPVRIRNSAQRIFFPAGKIRRTIQCVAGQPVPKNTFSVTRVTLLGRLAATRLDKDAWREFVEHYGSRILRWCRSRGLQDADAEDLTQDLLVKLSIQMKTFKYDPAKSFHAWLKTITINALIDALKKRRRARELMDNYAARKALIEELQPQFDREALEEAMARVELRVEPNTWKAFQLTGIEELSTSEAASQLDMPESRIRVYKARVTKLIREELQKLSGQSDNS